MCVAYARIARNYAVPACPVWFTFGFLMAMWGVCVNAPRKTKCTPWAMGCILLCIHDVIVLLTSTKWYIVGLWDIVPII